MSGKTLIQMETPTTQRTDAVEALAAYLNKTIEGGVLDLGDIKLVRSNKGDAFYGVTARKCSCPAQTFAPGQACKHQRQHFPQLAKPAASEPGSIRPTGSFKPFSLLPSEEKAKASPSLSPSMLIDLHDTTAREAAYWSIKEDRILWPVEA